MSLTTVYIGETPPEGFAQSLCLLGPVPEDRLNSWRQTALQILRSKGYEGVVFIPEFREPVKPTLENYAAIVAWERLCRLLSDVHIVWLPREPHEAQGLTTNFVVGEEIDSGKLVLGAPAGAWKVQYLLHNARMLKVPIAHTLEDTIDAGLTLLGAGAWRKGGEREVPLFIWRTSHFQKWYKTLQMAGNHLEHARVVWTHRVGPDRKFVFFWIIHAIVYIASEKRSKLNEIVLSRPDISTIVLYKSGKALEDTKIVLVREFRTPVANPSGYVWELPGGSSFTPVNSPLELAAEECQQETGLTIPPERFRYFGSRQLLATISAHQAHLFGSEITAAELAWLETQANIAHGVTEDTEQTYVEIRTLREIREEELVDWSMVGMIYQVITTSN